MQRSLGSHIVNGYSSPTLCKKHGSLLPPQRFLNTTGFYGGQEPHDEILQAMHVGNKVVLSSLKGSAAGSGCLTGRHRKNTPRQRVETIRCMAHPRRVARVAKQIEREIGNLILTDPVLQEAVCPEKKNGGGDDALSAIATVTEVELTNDLQVAKVYVSIFSDELGRQQAMAGLKNLAGYVRKHVADNVRLRLCPEIRFIRDDSIERGEQVMALLERIKLQAAGEVEPPPITLPSTYELEEVFDDDDDDEEEGGDSSKGREAPDGQVKRRRQISLSEATASARMSRRTAVAAEASGSWAPRSGGVSLEAEEDSDEEDGFLDLSEEDELVGEHDVLSDVAASRDGDGNQGQTGKATPQRNSIRRKVAQPGDGFFGFEEPGPLTWEEASLPLGRVQPVSEETGRRKRRPR